MVWFQYDHRTVTLLFLFVFLAIFVRRFLNSISSTVAKTFKILNKLQINFIFKRIVLSTTISFILFVCSLLIHLILQCNAFAIVTLTSLYSGTIAAQTLKLYRQTSTNSNYSYFNMIEKDFRTTTFSIQETITKKSHFSKFPAFVSLCSALLTT